jgi:hypothetical protein
MSSSDKNCLKLQCNTVCELKRVRVSLYFFLDFRNITVITHRHGVAIGSEMSGGVNTVLVENCAFTGRYGVRIKASSMKLLFEAVSMFVSHVV